MKSWLRDSSFVRSNEHDRKLDGSVVFVKWRKRAPFLEVCGEVSRLLISLMQGRDSFSSRLIRLETGKILIFPSVLARCSLDAFCGSSGQKCNRNAMFQVQQQE